MKNLLCILQLIMVLIGKSLSGQDLLIINDKESIPCKIKSIINDSIIEYNSIGKEDPYFGYIRKPYYKEVKYDYFTDIKRNRSMNKGLGSLSAGACYSSIPIDPAMEILFDNDDLNRELSIGLLFNVAFQHNIYPKLSKLQREQKSPLSLSIGLSYGFFRSQVNDIFEIHYMNDYSDNKFNIKRNVHAFNILVSIYTRKKYETHFSFKPGIHFNNNSGQIDNQPMKSKAVTTEFAFSCDQEILHFSKNFSVFLTVSPSISFKKSGRMEYERFTYHTSFNYINTHKELGFYAGLYINYFY